jgi:hypothetical protein
MPEDCKIVPYNLELLILWEAHLNVQKVTENGWEQYLAKYVAKAEPSTKMHVGKRSEADYYLSRRLVGIIEAMVILLQIKQVQCNRQVEFLPTDT